MRREGQRLAHELYRSDPEKARTAAERGFPCNRRLIRGWNLAIDPPPGQTRFSFLWEFMLDHPMGVAGGASPWRNAGMPSFAPSWCSLPP